MRGKGFACAVGFALWLGLAGPVAAQPGKTTTIAITGQQAPGTPTGVVFDTFSFDKNNPLFLDFFEPVLNNAGQVAYFAFLQTGSSGVDTTNDRGIWITDTNGQSRLVAREGSQAPGTGTTFERFFFDNPSLNDAGQVAYSASLAGANDAGLWRDNTLVVAHGSLGPAAINNAGQMAYFWDSGVWRDNTLIVRSGSQAPDTPAGTVFGSNNFGFFSPLINDAGQVVYGASLTGTDVTSTNDTGIWRDNTLIVRAGSQAPGTPVGTVFTTFFSEPVLNDNGQVAFESFLTGAGVNTNNDRGIWITGTNGQSLLVARDGDSLTGKTISTAVISIIVPGAAGGDGRRNQNLNNFSQLAYQAFFTNGDEGIFLFTPDIHWTQPSSGDWDTANNWTIGQLPGDPHDVFIDPTANLTVTGPTGNVTLTNLTIGGNNGIATLSLAGGTITASNSVVVTPTGVLTGEGIINGTATILGDLAPGSGPGTSTFGGPVSFGPLSTTVIEIQGTTPGTTGHDQIVATQSVSLDGTLDLQVDTGIFTPIYGNAFTILTYTSRTGTYNRTTLNNSILALQTDLALAPVYDFPGSSDPLFAATPFAAAPNSLTLFTTLPGDANLDLQVEDADLSLLLTNFGNTGAAWNDGDFTGDGIVDDADLSLLLTNFGSDVRLLFSSTGLSINASTIPEPSTLATWVFVVVGFATTRRLRRRS